MPTGREQLADNDSGAQQRLDNTQDGRTLPTAAPSTKDTVPNETP